MEFTISNRAPGLSHSFAPLRVVHQCQYTFRKRFWRVLRQHQRCFSSFACRLPKIELNARKRRQNWDGWGNEAGVAAERVNRLAKLNAFDGEAGHV